MQTKRVTDWKRGEYPINDHDGKFLWHEHGYISGHLGIAKIRRGVWRLTHLPTGARICDFPSLTKAMRAVDRVAPLVAWGRVRATEPGRKRKRGRKWDLVRATIRQYGGRT